MTLTYRSLLQDTKSKKFAQKRWREIGTETLPGCGRYSISTEYAYNTTGSKYRGLGICCRKCSDRHCLVPLFLKAEDILYVKSWPLLFKPLLRSDESEAGLLPIRNRLPSILLGILMLDMLLNLSSSARSYTNHGTNPQRSIAAISPSLSPRSCRQLRPCSPLF